MRISILAATLSIFVPTLSYSQTILTVFGPDNVVKNEYSLEDLDALEQIAFETRNPYIDGSSLFSGPSLELIVDQAGYTDLEKGFITLSAINDYQVRLPVSDFRSYNIILATRRDHNKMSLRDKGPIWVMYPMSDHRELQDPLYDGRLVWQLQSLQVSE